LPIRARVPVPIRDNIAAEMVSFRIDGHASEDIAVLFPGWEKQTDMFVRIHSECLTGDVFGSRRCDCGAQLDEAITRMAIEGGIILYLRQEGRGIGLHNKLDAYALQSEKGQDTFEANAHLGFPEDARDYKVAAKMLADLGVKSVRLLSNNGDKAKALANEGINVAAILPTTVHVTDENASYLETKQRHGHTFQSILKKSA
jgi:GTP cyclohydrolase II